MLLLLRHRPAPDRPRQPYPHAQPHLHLHHRRHTLERHRRHRQRPRDPFRQRRQHSLRQYRCRRRRLVSYRRPCPRHRLHTPPRSPEHPLFRRMRPRRHPTPHPRPRLCRRILRELRGLLQHTARRVDLAGTKRAAALEERPILTLPTPNHSPALAEPGRRLHHDSVARSRGAAPRARARMLGMVRHRRGSAGLLAGGRCDRRPDRRLHLRRPRHPAPEPLHAAVRHRPLGL